MTNTAIQRSVDKCNTFFKKNYSLNIPEDWLNQCIEFALEEDPVRKKIDISLISFVWPKKNKHTFYSKTAVVENIVYSHLVDFDINEIGSSCLPSAIEQNQSGYFEGIFFVQVFEMS